MRTRASCSTNSELRVESTMSISSKSSWKAVVMVATTLLIYYFAVAAALPDGDGASVVNDVGVAKQVRYHQPADSSSPHATIVTADYLPPEFGRPRRRPKPPFVGPPPRYFGPPPPPKFFPSPFIKPPLPWPFCPPPKRHNP